MTPSNREENSSGGAVHRQTSLVFPAGPSEAVNALDSWLPSLPTDQRVDDGGGCWATVRTAAEGALPVQRRTLLVAGMVILLAGVYASDRLWL